MENLSGNKNQFLDNENDDTENSNTLMNSLITIWKNEKFTNDILLYQNNLISNAINLVEKRKLRYNRIRYRKNEIYNKRLLKNKNNENRKIFILYFKK